MNKRIKREKIKKIYPGQWVSIIETDTTPGGFLDSGIVIGNNKNKKDVVSEFKKQKNEWNYFSQAYIQNYIDI